MRARPRRHFGRAAQRLHIAQPSLSQQIRRLEQQLGVTLLDRSSRSVELTAAGRTLQREGRRLLAQSRCAVRATRAAAAESSRSACRALPRRSCPTSCAGSATATRRSTSASTSCFSAASMPALGGEVDVAFTRLLPGQADIEVEVLRREPRLVALPAAHPLAGRGDVSFVDLRAASFITNPVIEHSGAPARWLAEQRGHGLPGRVAAEASSIEEILTLVAAGRGACLVPATVAQHHLRPDLRHVEVADADPAVVSLAWPRSGVRPVVEAFIATALAVAAAPTAVP